MTENQPDAVATSTWHRKDADAILRQLGTTAARGLAVGDADRKLAAVGPNEIESRKPAGFLRLLGHQLADFMIGLLLVAAIISGVLGDLVDTIAIVVIVIVNAAVGVFQEYRAQRAIAALREMSAPTARVIRDGAVQEIDAREVVPGDIVRIEAGDVVPADLRLVDATDLGIDESALTGESVPAAKHEHVGESTGQHLGEFDNMAFKSTLVTRGRGTGVTVATGRATEIGRVADLLRGESLARTPLQTRLAKFSRRIALAVVAICALVFTTGLMQGQPVMLMFLTAVSLAVAAVPEALPAVITVALGLGARRLSELNALVRRLPAVESLGAVTYICADKTGTLTENRMRLGVVDAGGQRCETIEDIAADRVRELVGRVLALCNDVLQDGNTFKGEPTEVALLQGAIAAGFDKATLENELQRVAELPFESERRCMVTEHDGPDGRLALIKGAPERLLQSCHDEVTANGRQPLDPGHLETADALAREGFRVLALAIREDDSQDDLESGWSFLGLVGLIDPPRQGVSEAIRECRNAGIVPVMITGDHPSTALAIAARIGISSGAGNAVTGEELATMSDMELEHRIEDIRVYARVNPEQKIRIVRALQNAGHFVAMTGDGVNDAPALKHATIGIAMGERGTEVAREAAEIVLLDDSFATIVAAVHEGRRVFDDIRKFIRYTLTSNSGEIWVLMLAPFLGLPIPLLPLHILWINLVTDGLPGLALSAEPAERDVMQRPPRPAEEGIFSTEMIAHIFWIGLAIGGLTLGVQAWALARDVAHWQTMVFTVLVVSQLFHSMAIRSERESLFTIGLFSNPALLLAIAVTVAAQLLVIYLPPLNAVFGTAPLSATELGVCFGLGALVLLLVEADKLVRRLRQRSARSRSS
jgi:Ca2+-transporting ATPase